MEAVFSGLLWAAGLSAHECCVSETNSPSGYVGNRLFVIAHVTSRGTMTSSRGMA